MTTERHEKRRLKWQFCFDCLGLFICFQEMHIQLSSATYEHLKGSHFIFERRGTITIKVRGVKTVSTATLVLHSRSHSNKYVIIIFR